MQQSLQILRMTNQELTEYIKNEAVANPLLEMSDNHGQSTITITPLEAFRGGGAYQAEDRDFIQNISDEYSTTFTEMLIEQLGHLTITKEGRSICEYIIRSLNRKGYLEETPEELALDLGLSVFDIMQCIYIVQSLEPAGVGALTTEECLILQLSQSSHFNPHTIKIVKYHLHLLAEEDAVKNVAKAIGCSEKAAKVAVEAVKSLNPIPSRGYNTGDKAQPIIPDATITVQEGALAVEINKNAFPMLEVNNDYTLMLEGLGDADAEKYIKANLLKAETLIGQLEQRKQTLYQIIFHLINVQKDYFLNGGDLISLTMNEVAQELDLNVSTISRGVQGKYIRLGNTAISLRSLFTGGYALNGGIKMSINTVKEKIMKFVAAEDKKNPLTDEDLSRALEAIGLTVSRRTVAKYRTEIGIKGSSGRKMK